MALFDVPGWTVPSQPVAQSASRNRKRKRGAKAAPADDDTGQIRTAQVNVEKLMQKLDASGQGAAESQPKKKKRKHTKSVQQEHEGAADEGAPPPKAEEQIQKKVAPPQQDVPSQPKGEDGLSQEKKKRKRQRSKHSDAPAPVAPTTPAPKSAPEPKQKQGLTALQANMKNSLDGARFRYVFALRVSRTELRHAAPQMDQRNTVQVG